MVDIVLIDGDVIGYKAAFANQKVFYTLYHKGDTIKEWPPGVPKRTVVKEIDEQGYRELPGGVKLKRGLDVNPAEVARYSVDAIIKKTLKNLEAEDYEVFLTHPDVKKNFRYEVAKTQEYKANRKSAQKPVLLPKCRDWMQDRWDAELVTGEEADDRMSILAGKYFKRGMKVAIATVDKDLRMVPNVWYYDLLKEEADYITDPGFLSVEKGRKLIGGGLMWFYAQCLLGDAVDNIPKIPGYGPVKVYKTLSGADTELEMYSRVSSIYRKVLDLPREQADSRLLEVGQLLWMRRRDNEMWLPPTKRKPII